MGLLLRQPHPEQQEWRFQPPAQTAHPHLSSKPRRICVHHSRWPVAVGICAATPSVSKMCPEVSEKPERHYFWGLETLKNCLPLWLKKGFMGTLYLRMAGSL